MATLHRPVLPRYVTKLVSVDNGRSSSTHLSIASVALVGRCHDREVRTGWRGGAIAPIMIIVTIILIQLVIDPAHVAYSVCVMLACHHCFLNPPTRRRVGEIEIELYEGIGCDGAVQGGDRTQTGE